jgi:hypothetical protein
MSILEPTRKIVVRGISRDGQYYDLKVDRITSIDWDYAIIVDVRLPFDEDHKIWEELRND